MINNYILDQNQKMQINKIKSTLKQCLFCTKSKNLILFIHENIHIRYYDVFNFYFAKSINEILVNYSIPHVVYFKDY